jgi:hypothetical protein
MVFKVKQKSQGHYYNHVTPQVGQASTDIFSFDDDTTGYKIGFNWPYDYLSFVELIKMDAEVLFSRPQTTADPVNEMAQDPSNQRTRTSNRNTETNTSNGRTTTRTSRTTNGTTNRTNRNGRSRTRANGNNRSGNGGTGGRGGGGMGGY